MGHARYLLKQNSHQYYRNFVNYIQYHNVAGEERDHAFAAIGHWISLVQTRVCHGDCSLKQSGTRIRIRDMHTIYRLNVVDFLRLINTGEIEKCTKCKGRLEETWEFEQEPPEILFYCLQGGAYDKGATTESRLPIIQVVKGIPYQVFAYSLYQGGVGKEATSHIVTGLYNNGNRVLFDGLMDDFKANYGKKLSEKSVISVWLVKAQ
jgi:hypothetical protein